VTGVDGGALEEEPAPEKFAISCPELPGQTLRRSSKMGLFNPSARLLIITIPQLLLPRFAPIPDFQIPIVTLPSLKFQQNSAKFQFLSLGFEL